MFSLRRQWHRFQLARELLEQYEWEDEHRMSAAETLLRLEAAGYFGRVTNESGKAKWREAVAAKAEQYPSDAC